MDRPIDREVVPTGLEDTARISILAIARDRAPPGPSVRAANALTIAFPDRPALHSPILAMIPFTMDRLATVTGGVICAMLAFPTALDNTD